MEPLLYPDLLKAGADCPRRDNARYLADCVIRRALAGDRSGLPAEFQIVGGIGTLTLIAGEQVFEPAQPVVEPTAAELAANFTVAVARWAGEGFPVVSRETYDARAAVCEPCEFWDGAARLGLGKCTHKKCGCTKMKRWLATEKCPLGKWGD